MSRTPPRMEITKHPDFKVVHVNGVFGGLNPNQGNIIFYTDIIEPRCKTGGKFGELEPEKINRELQIDVRMSIHDFIGIAEWMNRHIKLLEEKGVIKKADIKSQKKTSAYSV
jgi:hypothetical protein